MEEKPDLLAVLAQAGVSLPERTDRPFFVLCPFHRDEKHPNLHVDPERGLFHCFACGVATRRSSGTHAARFYHLALMGPAGEPARALLERRGIDLAAMQRLSATRFVP